MHVFAFDRSAADQAWHPTGSKKIERLGEPLTLLASDGSRAGTAATVIHMAAKVRRVTLDAGRADRL